uniref:Prolyl 4-hydroxylase alpha subunit domain-containing protein n=1 Tax=Pyrodinium bahamense TaxID=73915 RepID=A0A7S0A3H7_9DINO
METQQEANLEKSHTGGLPVPFSLDLFRNFDVSSVAAEPVEPVDSLFGRYGGRCLLLRNALSAEECALLIRGTSGDLEPVRYRRDYRRNDRCIYDSPELAELLWRRVERACRDLAVHADRARQRLLKPPERQEQWEPHADDCPDELQLAIGQEGTWRPVGLNECLRFCRYEAGGFFRAHTDGCFCRSEEERSLFTCMFYLDGALEGGATRFLRPDAHMEFGDLGPAGEDQVLASVAPRAGQCLLFFQPGLLHEGAELLSGVKHILRTDVMCRRDPDSRPRLTPQQAEALDLLRRAQEAEERCECDRAVELYRRAFKLDRRLERMC